MAEIRTMTPKISVEGARRLSASLAEMVEQGVAGPRGPQIRGLGLSLETLVGALRRELTRIGASDDLNDCLAKVERLAALARAYSGPNVGAAPDMEGDPIR
ncbi:hypothetical protein MKK63_06240 [Methylobacterium sp. J-088]|uniref:hypothetical protein n=1 Tax=Methylobacterium sp. J-088 TaxID=2836664 RepID=UPI001FBBB4E6|nr:hypothetical protein [Methylobacterium sp. J-088]MCJ2062300.1 hypothetical protein [Methylobacterium sp. J-088]